MSNNKENFISSIFHGRYIVSLLSQVLGHLSCLIEDSKLSRYWLYRGFTSFFKCTQSFLCLHLFSLRIQNSPWSIFQIPEALWSVYTTKSSIQSLLWSFSSSDSCEGIFSGKISALPADEFTWDISSSSIFARRKLDSMSIVRNRGICRR